MRHLHITTGLFARTLRSKPEDAITEVLAALLRSEAIGLQVLHALLPDKNTSPDHVSTQYRGVDGSRPDLVLSWPGEIVVIEVKFGARLQETQRNGYRAALSPEDPPATFYFLAPVVRRERIEDETKQLEQNPGFISWEGVVETLARIREGNETERVWLQELIEAIRQEASLMHQPRKITQSELDILSSKDTAPAIANCLALVHALHEFLKSPRGIPEFKFDSDCSELFDPEFQCGFYVETVGSVDSFVGFHLHAWRFGSQSPIGIELWRPEQQKEPPTIERPADSFVLPYEDGTRTIWIPLSLSIKEPDDLLQDLRDRIAGIYERLPRR